LSARPVKSRRCDLSPVTITNRAQLIGQATATAPSSSVRLSTRRPHSDADQCSISLEQSCFVANTNRSRALLWQVRAMSSARFFVITIMYVQGDADQAAASGTPIKKATAAQPRQAPRGAAAPRVWERLLSTRASRRTFALCESALPLPSLGPVGTAQGRAWPRASLDSLGSFFLSEVWWRTDVSISI
jgi:hypothetical protein